MPANNGWTKPTIRLAHVYLKGIAFSARLEQCRFRNKSGLMVGHSVLFRAFSRASNGLSGLNVHDSEPGFHYRAERVRGPLPDPSRLAFG